MARKAQFDSEKSSRYNRYFSDAFKESKVKEIDKGISSVSEICKEYSISRSSVYKWIYQYSKMRKKGIRQIVESQSDTRKLLEMKARIAELERIIGQKQLLIDFQSKLIDLAEEEYQVDIKKKYGSKPSSGSGSTEANTDTP